MEHAETLNAAQAGAVLFADTETILTLARQGLLPGAKIGKSWVFLRQDVLEFLRSRIAQQTDDRRRQLQAAAAPIAMAMPILANTRRRKLPTLPALPPQPQPLKTTKDAAQDHYRVDSRNVSASANPDVQ